MNLEVSTTYTLTLDSKEAYLLKSLVQNPPVDAPAPLTDFCDRLREGKHDPFD